MAEQTPAVTTAPPPGPVMRVVNPLVRILLRTPLAGGAGKQLMVLNFSGRKSGRHYSVPVTAHPIDGALYALMAAPWKFNFRGGATAEVLYDGKTTAMRGELIEDRAVVADLFHRCATRYGAKRAQRMMGLKFRDRTVPTLSEFREAVEQNKLAAIRFTAAESR